MTETGREQALQSAADRKLSSVRRAIERHIRSTLAQYNDGVTGEDANWFTYIRRDAGEVTQVELVDETTYRFGFRINLVGSVYLMSKLAPEARSRRSFDVELSAAAGDDEAVTLNVQIQGSESRDAFPRYAELFEDGIYDIAVHFGGDYNDGRFDLETAKWLVETLIENGWTNNEVRSFDDLRMDSPPFTRQLEIEGRPVEARVYVFHAELASAEDAEHLAEAMRESFRTTDVVIYSGHAGENAGFILDYHPRFEIPARDFATLPMAEKYQIFVLDGCRTYRTYVDDILENPAKTYDNVDIVTTVNTTPFSVGYQTIHEFIHWLTLTDQMGRHFPVSWLSLLRGLNTESYDSVHYGVHGIDTNPRVNPHSGADALCSPCVQDADCGAGGNFCLSFGNGTSGCGVACTSDDACGPGFRCARVFDAEEYFYIPRQCVPTNYSCQ